MLLAVMILCAIGAVVLFGLGVFHDLWDAWSHPDHGEVEDDLRFPKPKSR